MFTNLSEFMKSDGQIALSVLAVIFLASAWKKSDFMFMAWVLIGYAIITSVINGTAILSFVGKFLRLFGIETGL